MGNKRRPLSPATDDESLPSRPENVQLRARRSPKLMAFGVLLTCLGGLIAAFVYNNITSSQSVLLLTRTVQRGQQLTQGDLAVVTVATMPAVATVPAEKLPAVLGKSALVDLPKGSLLGAESIGEASLPRGSAQVGLKLTNGRLPKESLMAGAKVKLVEVVENTTQPGQIISATLISAPQELGDKVTTFVDVRVAEGKAALVAVLAAQDKLALIRQADS